MKRKFISSLCMLFIALCSLYAQDKGYKNGFYGPYNQHPIVKNNKQLSSGAQWVSGSTFMPTVKTSSINEKDKLYCEIGLSVEKVGNYEPVYYVNVNAKAKVLGYVNIFKDSPLLIKLKNGEVITLYCRETVEDRTGQMVSAYFNVSLYQVIAQYKIDPDLIDLFKDGIIKIRFEANAEKWDFNFNRHKKDELGEFLYNEKRVITDALNKQTDFDEGF